MTTMLRLGVAGFLVWHGAVHVVMWRFYDGGSWQPRHSWLFGDLGGVAVAVASVAAIAFAIAGLALLTDRAWWGVPAVAAGAVSIALMLITFDPRWLWGIGIDVGVIAAATVLA
jgi:hypothetical protein